LPPAPAPPGRWLAVCPEDIRFAADPASDVVRGLAALGLDLTVVTAAGPGRSRAALAAALTAATGARPFAGVLSLLADEPRPHPEHPELPGGVALTLALVQALGDAGIDAPLWCVTRGTAVLGAGERPGPVSHAAVAGLGRTAALEHPGRWGGLVDLPPDPDERALRRLCAVLTSVTDEDQVAVRSTGVHGRRLLPAPVRRDPPPGRGAGDTFGHGTVLITGGTGGVGAQVARWLAKGGTGHLLLVSRSGARAAGADELRTELRELGAAVTIAACDAADPDRLRDVIGALPGEQPLTAVVHAAGVLDDGTLDSLTPARTAACLRAKLTAAHALHEATAGHDLAAFVVFSSLMGVVGNAGQAGYTAANAALEAFVAGRRAEGLPGTAIAWGAWAAGEGMLREDVVRRLRDRGLPSMAPEAAVTAIGRAVTEDDGLVVVADADWRRFADTAGPRPTALLSVLCAPDGGDTGDIDDTGGSGGGTAGPAGAFVARLAELPAADRPRFVTDLVRAHAAAVLRHTAPDAIPSERAFSDMGFDSLTSVELRNRLAAATGLRLPATVLFDRPTPRSLVTHVLAALPDVGGARGGGASVGGAVVAGGGCATGRERGAAESPAPARHDEPVAIVGMGCRFPGGVRRPADLWRLLADGRDAVTRWPADRGWDTAGLYDPDPDRPGTTYCAQGGFLEDAAGFDAAFFGISPREALAMDPQQRLLLEISWEAAESAGQAPASLRGHRVGVFVGTNGQDYIGLLGADPDASEGHFLTGNTASVLSGRIAYTLGLEGPALTVDTACSSSLVALHLAVQALRRGDCDQAFAGGATVMSTPRSLVEFSRQRGLAPDGRCKAFGAGADGTGWGEGAGMLLLKRLSDARRDGHPVLAVIRGSAVNQDGASNGLTAPHGPAQQQVVRAALADARLAPGDIDAVEAHGTGTALGDPIEAQALQAVHGRRPGGHPLWLGSVKSNIGHTQAAAGVAGVIKMVLALRTGELPATLHADDPSPHIDWSAADLRLLTRHTPWPATGAPRRAGVSSFGISGTNAHVILEQAPPDTPSTTGPATTGDREHGADPGRGAGSADPVAGVAGGPNAGAAAAVRSVGCADSVNAAEGTLPVPGAAGSANGTDPAGPAAESAAAASGRGARPGMPLLLSARDPHALRAQAAGLRAHLKHHGDSLADIAHALVTRRNAFEHRAAVLRPDGDDEHPENGRAAVLRALETIATGGSSGRVVTGRTAPAPRTAFLFPGQGSQRTGAGARLYRAEPVFADALDDVLTHLAPHLDLPLRDIMFAEPGTERAALLHRTRCTQPALFALAVALFRLMDHRGVRPGLLIGHSVGGLAAAHAAGVLDLPGACALVAARGRLMDALPGGGAMAAVEADEDEIRAALAEGAAPHGDISVAAVNGPRSTVVSGDRAPVLRLAAAFRAQGRRTRELTVSHAFHSAHMDPMLDDFRRVAEGLTYSAPRIPVLSDLTGERATADELCDPGYWVRHARGTVRFFDGVRRLLAEGITDCLELGPGGVLSGLVQDCLSHTGTGTGTDADTGMSAGAERDTAADCRAVPLLRDGRPEDVAVVEALARLYVRGVPVNWRAGWPRTAVPHLDLPTYPFRHRRFWPASPAAPLPPGDGASERTGRAYRVGWRALPEPAAPRLHGTWLLIAPGPARTPLAGACARALEEHGAAVTTVPVPAGTDRSELATLVRTADATGVLSLLAPTGGPEATLLLVQALGDAGVGAPLWCATTGAVACGDDGPPDPVQAQVWGLGRVAALEHPGRWGGLVDLPPDPDGRALRRLCAVLSGTVRAEGGDICPEDQVAIRADGLHGRRLLRASRPGADTGTGTRAWPPRGTVLITGGTGGLGAQVARLLAKNGAGHLVLTSRRGPDAPGAAALTAELTALGARTTVVACDVADRSALRAVVDDLRAHGDTVRAVFHTAGLTSDTPLPELTPARFAEETAAKVRGATHLDALFGGGPDSGPDGGPPHRARSGGGRPDSSAPDGGLDAFVLFSSVSAVWGSGRQGSYAAANAHLDALAEQRRSRGLAATSVAWGPWAGAGMAHGATGAALRRHGLVPMAPEAALTALQDILERGESGTVVADLDWARFTPAFTSARVGALLSELPEAQAPFGHPSAPPPGSSAREPDADPPAAVRARWRARLAPLPGRERHRALTELVRTEAAAVLGHDTTASIAADRPFREIGFDSLTAVELRGRLAGATGLPLPATTVFDHPTAVSLGSRLYGELTGTGTGSETGSGSGSSEGGTGGESGPAPLTTRSAAAPPPTAEPLAIIGMACRFPGGVRSPEDLWNLVLTETDAIGGLPTDRGWPLDALYDPDPEHEGTFYATGGGFLDGAGDFDAAFFGISPREALAMDPQQRLLLETSWEALEHAGIDPRSVRGSQGGVYLGLASQGYGTGPKDPSADVEGHLLSGTVTSVASGRVAYTLGTEGPAVTVETACSSSLVALHLAGQALRAGECSFALVGGAAVIASPDVLVEFSRQRGLSPDGRCRPFADTADGTGWSEGVGVLVVEPLCDARRNGHPVLAVIRGSAVNQDGASNGLTAPSGPAQRRVLRRALAAAGVTAADVDLVEAHGTGTTLGDPIEAGAVLAVYGRDRPAGRPLWLGSLKSNIGHTQAAAGVAGIIKTVMALRHGVLPRSLHIDRPSTEVDWSAGTVRLLTEARPWDTPAGPRRAGVSSFGMSGTNAHVVLEQAPTAAPVTDPDDSGPEDGPEGDPDAGAGAGPAGTDTAVWLLSAASGPALRAQARRLLEHAAARPALSPEDIAHALATTRTAFTHRAAVLGATRDELLSALAALDRGAPAPGAVTGRAADARTVFVFPGQGSQWFGMGRSLLAGSVVFAEWIAACERALVPFTGWSLTAVLRGVRGAPSLERVDVVQPVLFAVMVSLAELWRSCGVVPDAVVGHSQGEIAAAYVAGALTLDDAARVVALRSRELLRLAGTGGMVSLAVPEDQARRLVLPHGERIGVAAVNGPEAVVVAGEPAALDALLATCARDGIRARRLPVDYAAHSAQVAGAGDGLRTALADLRPRPCAIPLCSTVTGEPVDGARLDAEHWYRNLREPVAFAAAVEHLIAAGHDLFVEISPHPVLTAAIEATAERAGRDVAAVGTLRRDDGGGNRLLTSLAEAWTHGAPVTWSTVLPRPAT
ncbi:type I polyketide synthase, partial [Streptomyces clavuligerus]